MRNEDKKSINIHVINNILLLPLCLNGALTKNIML